MKNPSLKMITIVALMAALLCVLGPLSVPIGVIPISFTNLAICLFVVLIGGKKASVSCVIYLLIGLVGLPVFSGFQGGAGKLFGPTGGYLIGFIFLALISGFFVDRFADKKWLHALGMFIGTIVLYIFGTAWLSFQSGMSFDQALTVGVIPFFPFDMIKILIAVMFGPIIKTRIEHFL
ncbi:MAG: biotin transporter BioY [Clostridia bacterium]|nr:biotin transporter BioY [Clostridia bacterium]